MNKIIYQVLILALIMIAYEQWQGARSFPRIAGWWLRVILLNTAQILVVFLSTYTWDKWGFQLRLWHCNFSDTTGAWLGYVINTFFFYWWHRIRHEWPFLWRWLHQIHHSVESLEVSASFYKHPLEIIADSLLTTFICYQILGLSAQATAGATLLCGLAELFYHWNVKTPHWVGYFFQRPESHCLHHALGLHAYNYSDLPLWDMLFGTFRNPQTFHKACGFGQGQEQQLWPMLKGQDLGVSRLETRLKK
jgi:sterol desaturase/sphingolipid hydroxylase (fatty acid hydroxylase superfamily)